MSPSAGYVCVGVCVHYACTLCVCVAMKGCMEKVEGDKT